MRTYRFANSKPKPLWQAGTWVWWINERLLKSIRIEWTIPTRFWHVELRLRGGDSQRDVTLALACGVFAVWITFENALSRKPYDSLGGREIGVSIHDGRIWWSLWKPEWEWSSKHPKWWTGTINVVDIVLGRQRYTVTPLRTEYGTVIMPEGEYPCLVEFERAEWRRSRWPFPLRVMRAKIEPHTPIPVPGKGSASYNCGEDAIHGLTAPAATLAEAIAAMTSSVLTSRERYGGSVEWAPEGHRA